MREKFIWWDLGRAVLYLVGRDRKKYVWLVIVLWILLAHSLVPPIIIGLIVDFFGKHSPGESLKLFYAYVVILGVSYSLVAYIRLSVKKALSNIRVQAESNTKIKGFRKLMNVSYEITQRDSVGSRVQKIQNGTQAFRTLTGLLNNQIFYSAINFIGAIIILLFLSPLYAVLIFGYLVVFFWIVKYFYEKIKKISEKQNIAREKSGGLYVEGLSNLLTIKTSGVEKSFYGGIAGREGDVKRYAMESVALGNKQWKVFQVFNGFFMMIFLLFIGLDVNNGILSVGAIVMYFTYLQKIISEANKILNSYQNIIESKVAIGRMMPIFWGEKQADDGAKRFPKNWKKLELRNVNFKYSQEKKKSAEGGINNIDLKINRGQKIGLVGKTGSGKSTLAKILIGLYPINSGEYRIGKVNFYNVAKDELADNVSIVLQETEMFNLSLLENITLMQPLDKKILKKAIEISQLKEVIEKLPQGMQTIIGEKGYQLSGGERQRLGIARAIYRDAQIMIFDEATSALDNRTEKKIQKALEGNLSSKTLIFIAHRITTLNNVDIIYVFKNGRIVEQGRYQKLLENKSGEFYRLFIKGRAVTFG